MQDIYDLLYDVNSILQGRSLPRLESMLATAAVSGMLSNMLEAALAKHSRSLTVNAYHNGHPDLIPIGKYPKDAVQSGGDGVEVKSTIKPGGAVDFHGGRDQWLAVFVYQLDTTTEPAVDRAPLTFREVYVGHVLATDFTVRNRGPLGTRTSNLNAAAIASLRGKRVYYDRPTSRGNASRASAR